MRPVDPDRDRVDVARLQAVDRQQVVQEQLRAGAEIRHAEATALQVGDPVHRIAGRRGHRQDRADPGIDHEEPLDGPTLRSHLDGSGGAERDLDAAILQRLQGLDQTAHFGQRDGKTFLLVVPQGLRELHR